VRFAIRCRTHRFIPLHIKKQHVIPSQNTNSLYTSYHDKDLTITGYLNLRHSTFEMNSGESRGSFASPRHGVVKRRMTWFFWVCRGKAAMSFAAMRKTHRCLPPDFTRSDCHPERQRRIPFDYSRAICK